MSVHQPWPFALLLVLALASLALLIRAVLRTLSSARLLDVALVEQQEIDFAAAGSVFLCAEGPRFTPGFRRLAFELRLPGGAPVHGREVLFGTTSSGFARARVTLRRFELPFAGRYLLTIRGLSGTDLAAAGHRIVFMKPHTLRSLLLVVGITFASAAAIASLVFFLLSLVAPAAAIDPGRADGWVDLDGRRTELREAYAHLHPNRDGRLPFTPELRLVLADREIPQESLRGPEAAAVLELAKSGDVVGLLIRLEPDEPGTLLITTLMPPVPGRQWPDVRRYEGTGDRVIRSLSVAATRVAGEISCPPEGPACEVRFSAPLFNE